MRATFLLAFAFLAITTHTHAQDGIAPKTLTAIKRATAYIKVDLKGKPFASGSGFVVNVDGDTALVVTNHHVIEPKVQIEMMPGFPGPIPGVPAPINPRMMVTTIKNTDVSVVLDSGTKNERIVKAEVLAVDPQRDLAILRIKVDKDLPEPISLTKAPELVETLPVYTFGYPFGKVLAIGKGHPAITVGKAGISSLRENDDGDLAYVQIDGALNPGNSGGPIVDAKGQLVGVAVASIKNSSGIGLAIPGAEVRKMLAGRMGAYHINTVKAGDGKTVVNIDLAVIDPLNKVKTVTLHYLPASKEPKNAKTIPTLAKLDGVKSIELILEKHLASGKVTLEDSAEKELLLQATFDNGGTGPIVTKMVRQSLKKETFVAKNPKNEPKKEPAEKVEFAGRDGATNIVGGVSDPQFKDMGPAGSMLIGLEMGLGKFTKSDIIIAVRPVYLTKDGEKKGEAYGTDFSRPVTIKAKDGYALGALTLRTHLRVTGLRARFMRVKDSLLDPIDSYESDAIGGNSGTKETTFGGNGGAPVIGIVGKTNARDCTGLGLVFRVK